MNARNAFRVPKGQYSTTINWQIALALSLASPFLLPCNALANATFTDTGTFTGTVNLQDEQTISGVIPLRSWFEFPNIGIPTKTELSITVDTTYSGSVHINTPGAGVLAT